MSDFGQALAVIPVPAQIFEWPSMDFVEQNDRCDEFDEPWLGLSRDLIRAEVGVSEDPVSFAAGEGHLVVSLVEGFPLQPRPAVLLATYHDDGDLYAAQGNHLRIQVAVKTAELHAIVEQTVDAAQQQLGALALAVNMMVFNVQDSMSTMSHVEKVSRGA